MRKNVILSTLLFNEDWYSIIRLWVFNAGVIFGLGARWYRFNLLETVVIVAAAAFLPYIIGCAEVLLNLSIWVVGKFTNPRRRN